eukprot:TRINITY_DN487_c0_g1_i1.p3 TRINITY_DN487_c0_g1~~TRINITY_DN487_c0_g1_i1.p3  ORF type:complete len:116 (-),score=0.18 TRINITY_DN487_c0_g1_i1:61-408(-)
MTAMVLNISIALTPLQKIVHVWKTGEYKLIPVFFNMVLIVCATCWVIYSIILNYVEVLVPQLVIIAICIMAVSLYYLLKCRSEAKDKGEEKSVVTPNKNELVQHFSGLTLPIIRF